MGVSLVSWRRVPCRMEACPLFPYVVCVTHEVCVIVLYTVSYLTYNTACDVVMISHVNPHIRTVESVYKGHVGTIILVLITEVSSIQRSLNLLQY